MVTTASGMLGQSSSLSPYAGPYVTDMLGKGAALSEMPYQAYMGPLTAGQSSLQDTAFQGLANLTVPTGAQTTYDPMSFTGAGYAAPTAENTANSEAELQRGLLDRMAGITGTGYQQAFEQAQNQFNTEQQRQMAATGQAQQYGLQALGAQRLGGAQQRDVEAQGIAADIAQFTEERDYPYKQVQYAQSLLQGLPITTQDYQYAEPSTLSNVMSGAGGILGLFETMGLFGKEG